jgi:hypothetical protein
MFQRAITNLKLLNSKRAENTIFERKLIRDQALLSENDIKYLRRWSLSGFGVGGIFYLLLRNLYEPLALLGGAAFFGKIIENNWGTVLYSESVYILFRGFVWVLVLLIVASWAYGIYFQARHGRRLSWNRCTWKSIEEFKASEKKWFWFNFVASIFIFIGLSMM